MTITRRLYLDLDGVMADFDQHHRDLFGWLPNHDLTAENWAAIHAAGDFFFDMPLKPDAMELFFGLSGETISILTACPPSNYARVADQKRRWVRKHIGPWVTVLPVVGSHNKPLFMHAPGDILIDDYGKNCREWTAAGGLAIKHENATDTLEKLYATTGR